MDLSLSLVLTAAGAVSAAVLVRQLIEIIKAAFPIIDARISGASLSFVLTALLYIGAWWTVGDKTPEGVFAAALAWLSCATSAIGINASWDKFRAGSTATNATVPGD